MLLCKYPDLEKYLKCTGAKRYVITDIYCIIISYTLEKEIYYVTTDRDMNKLYVLIFLLVVLCTAAQAQKRTFLRLYSLTGVKFSKGYLIGTTDSSLFIHMKKYTTEIPVASIGYIKLNRSAGHEILWKSELPFALPIAVLLAGFKGANSGGSGTVTGALVGLGTGTIIGIPLGARDAISTKPTIFTINGDISTWKSERKRVDLLPVYNK